MSPRLEVRPPAHGPSAAQLRALRAGRVVAVVALGLATLLLMTVFVFDDPSFVPRVELDNPSEYDINVAVAPSTDGATMPLGVALQHCVTPYHAVIDQGATWVVRFSAQGHDAGFVTVARADLVRDGWRLRVPDDVAARLRANVTAPPQETCSSA